MGVPVKPMRVAFGSATRDVLRRSVSYWLRCASSAMTMMFARSESTGISVRRPAAELLDRREDDPAGRRPSSSSCRLSAPPAISSARIDGVAQVRLAREVPVELVVEVDAVGDADDRRVREARVAAQLRDEEDHRVALAGALRVPDHAAAAVRRASRSAASLDRGVDGVRPGGTSPSPCTSCAPSLSNVHEVADEVEEARGLEDAFEHRPASCGLPCIAVLVVHRLPLGEVLGRRRDRPDARREQVGDADDLDEAVQRRDRLRVVRDLVDGGLGGRRLVSRGSSARSGRAAGR